MKTLVLFSGGLDSTVLLHHARAWCSSVKALSFDYGQRHAVELNAARMIVSKMKDVDHEVIALRAPSVLPTSRTGSLSGAYLPGRNTIFLAYALSHAEAHGYDTIWLGANADDAAGFPDCRPKYIEAAAQLGAALGVRIEAPFLRMSKVEIIQAARRLGIDVRATWSCYTPRTDDIGIEPCGACEACRLRERAFTAAGA